MRETADRAGDRLWPLPLHEDYAEQLRSDIADLANVGGRPAGAITAAMFLKEFTGGLPWAHLDIAGTAWADEPKPFQPKGACGSGGADARGTGLHVVSLAGGKRHRCLIRLARHAGPLLRQLQACVLIVPAVGFVLVPPAPVRE